MKLWIKNTSGKHDSMLTFAVGGFLTTALSILCSLLTGSKIVLGHTELVINSPDMALVSAFLGATLLAYVNRRNKKDDIEHEEKKLKMRADAGVLE